MAVRVQKRLANLPIRVGEEFSGLRRRVRNGLQYMGWPLRGQTMCPS